MSQLWGMIIYEIKGDGCLIGLWNNNHNPKDRIMNEIARKRKGPEESNNSDEITGEYTVSWIEETGNKPACDKLIITSTLNSSIYHFQWMDNSLILFKGTGIRIGLNQIAVTYWDGSSLTL